MCAVTSAMAGTHLSSGAKDRAIHGSAKSTPWRAAFADQAQFGPSTFAPMAAPAKATGANNNVLAQRKATSLKEGVAGSPSGTAASRSGAGSACGGRARAGARCACTCCSAASGRFAGARAAHCQAAIREINAVRRMVGDL